MRNHNINKLQPRVSSITLVDVGLAAILGYIGWVAYGLCVQGYWALFH